MMSAARVAMATALQLAATCANMVPPGGTNVEHMPTPRHWQLVSVCGSSQHCPQHLQAPSKNFDNTNFQHTFDQPDQPERRGRGYALPETQGHGGWSRMTSAKETRTAPLAQSGCHIFKGRAFSSSWLTSATIRHSFRRLGVFNSILGRAYARIRFLMQRSRTASRDPGKVKGLSYEAVYGQNTAISASARQQQNYGLTVPQLFNTTYVRARIQ